MRTNVAQIAMDHQALLLHNDRGFETIAEMQPLAAQRVAMSRTPGSVWSGRGQRYLKERDA